MQLGEITEPRINQAGPPSTGEFTYIDISSVDNKTKRIVEAKRLPAEKAPSRARQRLRSGDVLVSMTRPNLNAVALVTPELDGAIGSTGFHVLRAGEDVLPQWLYYGVQSRQFVGAMSELVQGALYPAVRPKDIRAFDLPLPGLDEQRRIVAEIEKQFSRLDEAVANLKRVKDRLVGYKGSIISEAVGGSATAGDGAAPNGWRRARLGDAVAKITSGSRDWSPYYGRGVAIFLLAQNVRPMSPDFSVVLRVDPPEADPAMARSRVQRGDLLVTIVGANTGQACMVGELPGETFVCQSVALVRPLLASNAPYLNLWLNSPEHGRRYFDRCMYGQGRPHLGFDQLGSIPIAIPPSHEQVRIVAEVDRQLSIARDVEAEVDANLKRAQALRQAVLARAFAVPGESGQ